MTSHIVSELMESLMTLQQQALKYWGKLLSSIWQIMIWTTTRSSNRRKKNGSSFMECHLLWPLLFSSMCASRINLWRL